MKILLRWVPLIQIQFFLNIKTKCVEHDQIKNDGYKNLKAEKNKVCNDFDKTYKNFKNHKVYSCLGKEN
jgi:hypothetical protein